MLSWQLLVMWLLPVTRKKATSSYELHHETMRHYMRSHGRRIFTRGPNGKGHGMVGFILTGHGQFSNGLASAIDMVAGDQPAFQIVPFEGSQAATYGDELRQAENEYTGLIRFGCVESSVVEFVIDVFTELMQHYPHLTFELYAADGDDIREALDHGNLDMGFLLEPVEAAKYESIPLPWSDRWGIVVSENSPEAKLENISIQQLSDMRLILPRRWIVQDEIASWMGIAREHLNVLMYHNLPTLPIRFVQKGIGAVLCVEGSYGVRPAAGTRFLPLSPEQRAGHRLVRRRNIKPSKVCRLVWDTAQKYVSAFAQVDE